MAERVTVAYRSHYGFGSGDTNGFYLLSGTASIVNTVFDAGEFCLRVNPTTTGTGSVRLRQINTATGVFSSSFNAASIYAGFLFRCDTAPGSGSEIVYQMRDGSNNIKLTVRMNSARQLAVYDSAASLIATGSTVLSLSTVYHLGILTSAGTTGAYEVQINGASELSGTCDQLAANNASAFFGKALNVSSQSVDFYCGHVAFSDSGFPPTSLRVRSMHITGNGAATDWTGDYQDVDETPPHDGDTSYVTSSTSGHAETWTLESAASAGITGTVLAVSAVLIVRDEGGSSALRYRLRSGSTNSDSSSNNDPGATYAGRGRWLDVDPATGVAWTLAALDSIEIGVLNNANVAARCTFGMVEVLHEPAVASTRRQRLPLLGVG